MWLFDLSHAWLTPALYHWYIVGMVSCHGMMNNSMRLWHSFESSLSNISRFKIYFFFQNNNEVRTVNLDRASIIQLLTVEFIQIFSSIMLNNDPCNHFFLILRLSNIVYYNIIQLRAKVIWLLSKVS